MGFNSGFKGLKWNLHREVHDVGICTVRGHRRFVMQVCALSEVTVSANVVLQRTGNLFSGI